MFLALFGAAVVAVLLGVFWFARRDGVKISERLMSGATMRAQREWKEGLDDYDVG